MGMSMEMNKGHAKSANGKYYFPAVYEKNTKTKNFRKKFLKILKLHIVHSSYFLFNEINIYHQKR